MKKLQVVLYAMVIVGLTLFLLISGVNELVDSSKKEDTKIDYASQCINIEHSINGLIPIGTDYYYYAYNEEDRLFIIRADKKWLSKNFNAEGEAIVDGYTIKTYKKTLDSDVSREVANSLVEENIQADVTFYQDALYQSVAIKKILGGVFGCIGILAFILSCMVQEYEERKKQIYVRVMQVCVFLVCIMIISVMK